MDLFNVTTILLALAVWLLWYHWKTDCQKSLDLSRSSFFTNGHKNSYTEKTNNVQGKHPYCKLFFVKPKVCSFHRKWLQYRFLSPNFVNVFRTTISQNRTPLGNWSYISPVYQCNFWFSITIQKWNKPFYFPGKKCSLKAELPKN